MSLDREMITICEGMLEAINSRYYDQLNEVMDPGFRDHHQGLWSGVSSLEDYKKVLAYAYSALDLKAEIDIVFAQGNRIVTRVILRGRHIGHFMGLPPTGKPVEWTTIEFYRVEKGKIKERWAVDDMAGLLAQLDVPMPT